MGWRIELDPEAVRELRQIDKPLQRRILKFLRERIAPAKDPRSIGGALSGPLKQFWKYRVGDYRIICDIQDRIIRVLVLRIAHRRKVYRR